MKTKTFEVSYYGSRFIDDELELLASIQTDNTAHIASIRRGEGCENDVLCGDRGRKYTPIQESTIMALFTQVESDAWKAVNKYLSDHNYPTVEELLETLLSIRMFLNAQHEVYKFWLDDDEDNEDNL